jgi:hypothetical protein
MSDPSNEFIPRCNGAGTVIDGNVIMHNGLLVEKDGYYGDFSEILVLNKGCHEPGEERVFAMILEDIREGATMIELGSYWAFYTMWFWKTIKDARNFCIEPDLQNLELGKRNCALNDVTGVDFTQGFVGRNGVNIAEFAKDHDIETIDILHSDIQGYELEMLEGIQPLLMDNKVKYLFVSTHSNPVHYSCVAFLNKCGYRIIASADFDNETFCFDGIIVACHSSNTKFEHVDLGNRRHAKLVS